MEMKALKCTQTPDAEMLWLETCWVVVAAEDVGDDVHMQWERRNADEGKREGGEVGDTNSFAQLHCIVGLFAEK